MSRIMHNDFNCNIISEKQNDSCPLYRHLNSVSDFDSLFFRTRILGEGTYGVVYEALNLNTGKKCALKKVRIGEDKELAGIPTSALRETILLREIKHPAIVQLFEIAHIEAQLWISFELCDLDLRQYIRQIYTELKKSQGINSESALKNFRKNSYFLPIEQCKILSRQLLEGVAYCHSRLVIHRDLKPQNILLNNSGTQLKIADFGLARPFTTPSQQNTHEVVTLWYRAPELLLGDQCYTSALDIWSVGCIIAEMATGQPLFHGDCEIDTLFKIFRLLGTPVDIKNSHNVEAWHNVSKLQYFQKLFPKWKRCTSKEFEKMLQIEDPLFVDFLFQMLQYPAERRLTAVEALKHAWLAT